MSVAESLLSLRTKEKGQVLLQNLTLSRQESGCSRFCLLNLNRETVAGERNSTRAKLNPRRYGIEVPGRLDETLRHCVLNKSQDVQVVYGHRRRGQGQIRQIGPGI